MMKPKSKQIAPNPSKQESGTRQRKSMKIPLSLRMILDCYEQQNAAVDGVDFTEAVLVGKLLDISLKNGKQVLTFQDGTQVASILTFQSSEGLEVNKYYKFFCILLKTSKQFRLNCFGFKQINNMAMYNDHVAQVILRHLERTRGFRDSKSK